VIIADTNEFHPLIDGQKYRDAKEPDGTNHPIVIMRATYSNNHTDLAYGVSIAEARAAKLLVGHYGYMVAGVDAASQGHYFATIVKAHGGVRLGDTIWCDDEEGTGDQSGRVKAFLAAAHGLLNDPLQDEGVYSGAAFFRAHGLGSLPSGVLRWIAAYQPGDPNVGGEDLWQFTDNKVIPGVSGACDASIFKGDAATLMNLVGIAGPFRHQIQKGNRESIDDVAHRRNTTVEQIISFSKPHLNPANVAVVDAYMALRHLLRSLSHPSPVLPHGFVYWTVHP
jgi:GH25 family lysozyme M1 (1,4-beta-N-acetylmuramidase)